MQIPDRVQIVPLGYEKSRVMKPINNLKADTVILLRHETDLEYEADFQRELVEELEANDRIELEQRHSDIFSLESSLVAIKNAILDCSEDDEVYVNLATGSKLTAIAGMMACQSTGATPFYVASEFRGAEGHLEPPTEPLVKTAGEINQIPTYPLKLPNQDQQRVLSFIDKHDHVTKKQLIEFSETEALSFIVETESKSQEGKYRLLETNIIEPLKDDGYVEIEKQGREKHVRISEAGRRIVQVAPLREMGEASLSE